MRIQFQCLSFFFFLLSLVKCPHRVLLVGRSYLVGKGEEDGQLEVPFLNALTISLLLFIKFRYIRLVNAVSTF